MAKFLSLRRFATLTLVAMFAMQTLSLTASADDSTFIPVGPDTPTGELPAGDPVLPVDSPEPLPEESVALPDYTVSDLSLGGTSGASLVYTVSNLGGTLGVDMETVTVIHSIYVDGDFAFATKFFMNPVEDPNFLHEGESQTVVLGMNLTPGTHSVDACVDVEGAVSESDENNNCMMRSFQVLADLTIQDLVPNKNAVSFLVANIGTANVNPDNQPGFSVYVDGTEIYTELMTEQGDGFLPVGGTQGMTVIELPLVPGEVMVCVDSNERVPELDELNNCMSVSYEAPASEQTVPQEQTPSQEQTLPVQSDGGVPLGISGQTGGGSSGGSSSSHNDNDSDGDSGSNSGDEVVNNEEVVLTEEEVAACGAMAFEDVPEDSPYYESIYTLWCEGVIQGRSATQFGTTANILRDEASKIVARLFGFVTTPHGDLPEVTESSYTDVSADDPLAYYVEALTDEGFYEYEKSVGSFRPDEEMNTVEIASLIKEATGEEIAVDTKGGMTRGGFVDLVLGLFNK